MGADRVPRLQDYHMHTGVTVDSRMPEDLACERAVSLGIQEIAFTNHIRLGMPEYSMSREAFATHWERIRACQARFPGLMVRLGAEVDYFPGREPEIAAMLQDYESLLGRPFDFVLGAVHWLDGVLFSKKKFAPELFRGRDPLVLYCKYFDAAAQATRSGLFDVIAHPDSIKKYTHELAPPVAFSTYQSAVEPFIDGLLQSGTGMEINTKGLRTRLNDVYPSRELLELYVSRASQAGAETIITLGSDAHKLEYVGGGLLQALALMQELGLPCLSSFENRTRSTWKI